MRIYNQLIIFAFLAFFSCEKTETQTLPVISISDIELTELDEILSVPVAVQLSKASDVEISVNIVTFGGTASESDFIPLDTILTFQSGTTQLSIEVKIIGDEIIESDEFFQLVMKNPVNAAVESGRGTITIKNDDVFEFIIPNTGYISADSYADKTLVWEDNFDVIDSDTWTFEIGDGCPNLCGWGNNELEYYAAENASIVDGNLVIEARKQNKGSRSYTSARMITKDAKSFQYGRIDIRAVMPSGKGMWPAIWMLGNSIDAVDWPACGEIDIMEMVGGGASDSETHGTVHWSNGGNYANYGGSTKLGSGKLSDEFHVYSIEWDESVIKWYLDDVQYHIIDISPSELSEFREEFFFIINVAIGGNWPGSPDSNTVFPNWMIVDYIRVFQ